MTPARRTAFVLVAATIVAVLLLLVVIGSSGAPSPSEATTGTPPIAAATPSPSPTPEGTTTRPSTDRPAASGDAAGASHASDAVAVRTLLTALAIAPEHRAGYERELFPHWIDADGDGCDARREVLIEEAVAPPQVTSPCRLVGGRWMSAYDRETALDPGGLEVDHVVALAEAWDSGAYGWSAARREAFANDLDFGPSLIAVTTASNRAKSDLDPSEWLPPVEDAVCPYLAAWVAVKARWDLAVDQLEHDAIDGLLDGCPGLSIVVPPAP